MARVVISGADRTEGRELVRALAGGNELTAIVPSPKAVPFEFLTNPRVKFVSVDFLRQVDLHKLPPRVDAVYCCTETEKVREPAVLFALNVLAVVHLLEYARRAQARSFVLLSSGLVYAAHAAPLDEQAATETGSLYALSKLQAEMLVRHYQGAFAGAVIFRPFYTYGPGAQSRWLHDLKERLELGMEIEPAAARCNPVYVTDLVAAMAAASGRTGLEVFNVAGPETVEWRAVVERAAKILGTTPRIKDQDVKPRVGMAAAARAALAFTPAVGIEEGLTRALR